MAQIKVTPEELEAVSQQFKASRGQSEQIINSLKQKINGLQQNWEGMSQQKFFQEFVEAQKNMTDYLQLLDLIGQDLSRIAAKFRQADQAN